MRPKLNNCSPGDFLKLFKKLGGFSISEGGKHTKVTHIASGKATIIPRHSRVDPHISRSIMNKYLVRDLKYDADEIYRILQ
jgi:predicted RNA binding protein YcfA (HicA-like mRNA interferase family)